MERLGKATIYLSWSTTKIERRSVQAKHKDEKLRNARQVVAMHDHG
jgi:hypothetical protein